MVFLLFGYTLGSLIYTFIILFGSYWIYRNFIWFDAKKKAMLKKFGGPVPVPLLGNAWSLAIPNDKISELGLDWFEKYSGTFHIWLGNKPYVIIAKAHYVEKILGSNIHINKAPDYSVLHPWLGTGLLTSNGQKWFTRRKLLTPTFHFKILDDFMEIFNEQSLILVQNIRKNSKFGKFFDINPFITLCTLDIISETAMGKKINAQLEVDSEYVKAVYGISDISMKRLFRPWLRPDFIWKALYGYQEKKWLGILHNFTENVIAERKKMLKQKEKSVGEKKRRSAFLDLLIEVSQDGKVLSDLDIREETDTFMFEGHDTTSANLGWTLYLLGHFKEQQEKARKEIDKVFESKSAGDETLTQSDLSQLKYLDCCIKETLRMLPSVPFFARVIKQDCDLGDGKIIPADTNIVIMPIFLHQDEEYFQNPRHFIPERFFPENSENRHPFAYVPFSAGNRNCIGQKFAILEEKVVLAHILRNFTFKSCQDFQEDVQLLPELILRSKDGIICKFEPRDDIITK